MKKFVIVMVCLLSVGMIFGCSNGSVSQEEYAALKQELENLKTEMTESKDVPPTTSEPTMDQPEAALEIAEKNSEPSTTFNEEEVIAQLEVKEYNFIDAINTPWVFLHIKNNSPFNLRLNAELNIFNEDDEIIGVGTKEQEAFESGQETILIYMLDDRPSKIEYTLMPVEETSYNCVRSKLEVEINKTDKKAIAKVLNTSDIPAEFVEGTALFLNNGEVVGFDTNFFVDADNEIKQGKTINGELKSYEKYDELIITFTGRAPTF